MSGFAKVYQKILASSIWEESDATRIVWITLLVSAKANGLVEIAASAVYRLANVSPESAEKAISILSSPDPYSKTKAHQGRRIEIVDGGIQILNFTRYREWSAAGDPDSLAAKRQRRYRERKKAEFEEAKNSMEKASRCDTSASASASVNKKKRRRVLMKEVPDGWLPNDPHRELANNLGVDLDREAAKFSAYAFKNGFSCPDKRFSSWLHDAAKYSQKTSGKDSSGYKFGSIE